MLLLAIFVLVAAVHYAVCRATYPVGGMVYTILRQPLYGLVSRMPISREGDILFGITMAANSAIWGLAAALVVAVLRA